MIDVTAAAFIDPAKVGWALIIGCIMLFASFQFSSMIERGYKKALRRIGQQRLDKEVELAATLRRKKELEQELEKLREDKRLHERILLRELGEDPDRPEEYLLVQGIVSPGQYVQARRHATERSMDIVHALYDIGFITEGTRDALLNKRHTGAGAGQTENDPWVGAQTDPTPK